MRSSAIVTCSSRSRPPDANFAAIDLLAERVRRIGATTRRSISDISQLQTVPDDDDEFVPAAGMMRRLLDDNLHLAQMQRAVIAIY